MGDLLNNVSARAYDPISRLLTQTDPRSKTTTFAYHPLNRLTQLTDALNGVTRFGYDGNGNVLTVTDALNHTTTHEYDSMDRLNRRLDQVGAAETFTYDGSGNVLSATDRKGQTTVFTYDALNRRTQATYADGSTTAFGYDAVGRLAQASDSVGGTIGNTYDVLDRLASQATDLDTVSYQYDALGRRTEMMVSGQNPVTYTYDTASRLRTITQAPLNPVTIDYDALSRRTKLTLPNEVSTEYQYDAASRLTALIYRNAVSLLGDLSYTYDAAGNRASVGGSFARTLLPDPMAPATYDAANRQLTFGDKTLAYDANGNLTTITEPAGVTTFRWDARNRLVALSGSGVTASFTYDAFGRRIDKEVNGQLTEYLYDAVDIIHHVDPLGTTSYLRSLNIDEAFAILRQDGAHFSISDPLGSTVAVTDQAGNPVVQYTYAPFGETSSTHPAFPNAFQYTSRENDNLAGLYYYRARYYAPLLQRFLSEDPTRPGGGDWNLYVYAADNPTYWTDPTGLTVQYNSPPPKTVPVGPAIEAMVECLQSCLGPQLIVTGGAEKQGHSPRSKHYSGLAVDFGFNSNPLISNQKTKFFCCAKKCGFQCGFSEGTGTNYPNRPPQFHLQVVPCGKGFGPAFAGKHEELPANTCGC